MNAPVYSYEDQLLKRDDPDINDRLALIYRKEGRPLCMCTGKGVEMYIACINDGDSYIVKRMPNSGHLHHPDCDSFIIPPELSGRGALDEYAIAEDQETGLTKLRLDFSLSRRVSPKSTKKKDEEVEEGEGAGSSDSVKASHPKLSIRSVLHCLYEDAGLNKWSPKMLKKRNWYVIRKHMLQAASSKIIRSSTLDEILVIPETFNVEQKDSIITRRKHKLHHFTPTKTKMPIGYLIGEVKKFDKARFSYKMSIKHMPDAPVYLSEKLYAKVQSRFARELSIHEENESVHLLAGATFGLSSSGNITAENITFMLVNEHWLPFESLDELDLVNRAVNEKRYFIKGLRYNLSDDEVIASILLSDTGTNATAVYLVPMGAGDEYHEKLQIVTKESDMGSCLWDLTSEEPKILPPSSEGR